MEVIAPVAVIEGSQVAAARRLARDLAVRLGFDETATERVALVVTEIASNLVKHATDGRVLLSGHGEPTARVDVLALDGGPGMGNVRRCFEDGFSTAGSPGNGLGAVARLSDRYDVYSQPGHGTVLVASIDRHAGAAPAGPLEIAAVSAPCRGETVCGDAWAMEPRADGAVVMVVDGLGHGPGAAAAATAAVGSFRHNRARPPLDQLQAMHTALRPTRGAAAAVAELSLGEGRVVFAGIGNIAASIFGEGEARHLVSHSGILGHTARRIAGYSYPWPARGILVAHSDGLATVRALDAYPGLTERSAGVIAGVLYRDLTRGRDDTTVLVAKARRP